MKNLDNSGRKFNSKYILYGIMICFCILALIEIIYGQVQKKREQDRSVSEEANYQELLTIEEEKMEIGDSNEAEKDEVTDGQEQGPVAENENVTEESVDSSGQNAEKEKEKKYDMQIVFMGDSILDGVRDPDGVAYLIGESCNADVYNMSIGGTTAALLDGEEYNFNNWRSISLLGIVNAILGHIDKDIFSPYRAGEILNECDFSKTDYFIIEYGVNDFTAKIPNGRYLEDGVTPSADDPHTYVGALEIAISMLHNSFPDAKILLVSPHYCQFFSRDAFLGDAYSIDYGWGALIDYKDMCSYVYNQHKQENVLFYDTFANSGIDAYTADKYLEDGIHLTAAGRQSYADYAARIIKADFYPVE